MRNVIQFSSAPGLSGIWRNLAEQSGPLQRFPAESAAVFGRRGVQVRSAVRVGVGQRLDCGGRSAAEAPQGGDQEKRQAADSRVSRCGNPDRHGQCDASNQEDDTDGGRKKHKACDHFLQLPRETYDKVARQAWQEYGRVLVKVRRGARHSGKIGPSRTRETWGNILLVVSGFATQSGREIGRATCDARGRSLNINGKARRPMAGEWWPTGWGPSARKRMGPGASARPLPGGQNRDSDRELRDDCLSFVTPGQQGRSVAGQEDGN